MKNMISIRDDKQPEFFLKEKKKPKKRLSQASKKPFVMKTLILSWQGLFS